MKLKVCGMRDAENIRQLLELNPDFIGFIFYDQSPRYAATLDADFVKKIAGPQKVGVFVNAPLDEIFRTAAAYGLDIIQLHGDEPADMIEPIHEAGLNVIKVFRVSDALPDNLMDFAQADYFLFDTKTKQYGGSGQQFDWHILKKVNHPFLLSGGVGIEDIRTIKSLNLPHLIGIDINSRVELAPGLKDIEQIKQLKAEL